MSENPYESPESSTGGAESDLRARAQRSFRFVVMLFLLPAAYNYWAFDIRVVNRLPNDLANLCRSANVLGITFASFLIWYLGVVVLEWMAGSLRFLFAPTTDLDSWQKALYQSFHVLSYIAAPGAMLWAAWVFCIYYLKSDFYVVSWVVGIAAHLLAACWYVPLIYRWYRLAVRRK